MKYLTNTLLTFPFATILLMMIGCSGCGSSKVNNTLNSKLTNKTDTNQINTQVSITSSSNEDLTYKQPEVPLKRNYLGKDIDFILNPIHEGGEAWTTVWEENIEDPSFERMNRIVQLSPTVILYQRFPKEVAKNFHYVDQPDKIEFLDTTYKTIKTIDIWKDRPYQKVTDAKLTYWNFDSEGMGVIPYAEQKTPIKPNEYSLFTHVYSEGHHVVVNYELRSIKNVKNFGWEGYSSDVVGVKHTLYIYDLKGNLKYELKDLPSVDQAVVSNDGRYIMHVFGGMGLANANSPFATIERSGWALMRLEDQKVVYQEYTDDGILAFNRLWKDTESDLLILGYSTPSTLIDFDYFIFFDEINNKIYKRQMPFSESKEISNYWKIHKKLNYNYHIKKFNFEQIKIEGK